MSELQNGKTRKRKREAHVFNRFPFSRGRKDNRPCNDFDEIPDDSAPLNC